MELYDDLKKDIQGWRFVELCKESARMNGFESAKELKNYGDSFNTGIDLGKVVIPIHYSMIKDDEMEEYYNNSFLIPDFITPVIHLHHDKEDERFGETPEEMTIQDFICYEYPVSLQDAFKVLTEKEI
jgi:hypothetical protein